METDREGERDKEVPGSPAEPEAMPDLGKLLRFPHRADVVEDPDVPIAIF
jgi:hypothetical protein